MQFFYANRKKTAVALQKKTKIKKLQLLSEQLQFFTLLGYTPWVPGSYFSRIIPDRGIIGIMVVFHNEINVFGIIGIKINFLNEIKVLRIIGIIGIKIFGVYRDYRD